MPKQDDNVNHSDAPGESDLLDVVHSVMHRYRSRQYQVLRDGPHRITHMESKALGYFAQHAGATQTDLARDSGHDKAQLARLVKSLRERGLLCGTPSAVDARSTTLEITSAGRVVLRKLAVQTEALRASAVAGLTATERRQLVALMRRVEANLSA